jgi:hypothetical protein
MVITTRSSPEEMLAVLRTWKGLRERHWPMLLPEFPHRADLWPRLDERDIHNEVAQLLELMSEPFCSIRIYWKRGPELTYGGFNTHFLYDVGVPDPLDLLGQSEPDASVQRGSLARRPREDDHRLLSSAHETRSIERRDEYGVGCWMHSVRTALRSDGGDALGVLEMYEIIDAADARRRA